MPRTVKPLRITCIRRARLEIGAISAIHHDRAKLTREGDRFVMTGPSGTHSLLCDATNHQRLDAHWQIFASDPRNAYEWR